MAFLLTSQTIRRQVKGFTLIELIIVIAIIGILAVLGFGAYMLGIERARIARAQGDLDKIKKAVLQLELDTNLHPGQSTLTTCNTSASAIELDDLGTTGLVVAGGFTSWKGSYIDQVPKDAWNNKYLMKSGYICEDTTKGCESYDGVSVRALYSKGPDGVSGAGNETTDVDNIVTVLCK